jgi:hypothetical protein
MTEIAWIMSGVGAILLIAGLVWLAKRGNRRSATKTLQDARDLFHLRREWLEAEFLTVASRSGKPRGLSWSDCEFQNEVAFARERNTRNLRALVGVTVSFEAVEGGGMEDNPNVGNLREATAVFRLDGTKWTTDGRTLFNLNPEEAILHFHKELEFVE